MKSPMKQFDFKIAGETEVTGKLLFALTLEELFNTHLDLQQYNKESRVQLLRIHFMSYKPYTLSSRDDNYKFRPQSGLLEISLNVDFEVFKDTDEQASREMMTDFLLFALEEYIEIDGFDNLALYADAQKILAPYIPQD